MIGHDNTGLSQVNTSIYMILIEISQQLQHKYRVCEVHTKKIFFSDIRKIQWHRLVNMEIQVISPEIAIKMWVVSVKVRHLQAELFSNHRIETIELRYSFSSRGGGRQRMLCLICMAMFLFVSVWRVGRPKIIPLLLH